ncbi:MAG: TRAP transporter substrate-binding protein [Burkholderiaceae bacterium]|nr:TRAP transporter substrate-binding protein [Burkholderiaceae bacterium]
MNVLNLARAAAIAMTVLCASFTASAEPIVLKLHHFLGPQAPAHTRMLAPWAARIEKASGGKVRIELYPSMTLGGKPPQLIRQVRDGVVDIIWTVNGYTAGLFPRTEAFELPFVHTNDTAATNLAMRELFESDLAPEYEGVKVLFLHVHAGQGIQTVDRPVRKPEDLAGLKMRTPTRTGAWVIEALGATPVGMPVPDLPQALARKVVDGAFIPWEIIPALKLQDIAGYQIEGPGRARFGTTTFQVSMNRAKWDSLPPDVQQAFLDNSGEDWLREVGRIWEETEDVGIGLARRAGKELITLTEAELEAFRQRLEPVVQRWIDEVGGKGIDGGALVGKARTAIAKHAGGGR